MWDEVSVERPVSIITEKRPVASFAFLWEPIKGRPKRILLIIAFACLTAFRFPNVILHGRFWAEEGLVFYSNAWTLSWWEALLHPSAGYINVIPNIAGLLAYLVPIETAPYVTSGVALVVHCFPALLILFARDSWLQARGVIIAALVVIATPPGTEEAWLNSINSQQTLALCAAMLLALEPSMGGFGRYQKVLLALAPMSAPASWCLFPLFFLRAVMEKSWPRAVQGGILLTGVLVQLAFFFQASERELGIDPLVLNAAILVKHILLPLFGHQQTAVLAEHVASFATGSASRHLLYFVIPLFLAAGSVTLLKPRDAPPWFFLGGITIAALSYFAAEGDRMFLVSVAGSARYSYTPQVLFGLALLSFAVIHTGRLATFAQALMIWLLFVGIHDFFWPSAPTFAYGPNWREQVAKWRENPEHELAIWPRGWKMRLPAQTAGN
jgi:hypothetical protein